MPITTVEEQYKRLRSYLNPFMKGKAVDAVLYALAEGNAAYLINNIAAVNDQMYIATASERYLDELLAASGIVRPPAVGLSDDVFRQIGIEVKNRKQVRDLINNLLNAIFGDDLVRATSPSRAYEPYGLQDGDTLIVNFDDKNTVPITFRSGQFASIAAATAQEVADTITKSLRSLGFSGTAIAVDNGNGMFVQLMSDTVGSQSSVTVVGGRAQNELRFDSSVATSANMSTQWTISLQSGGTIRYTWSGGANPQLGRVRAGHYVNIFGGGFSSSDNEGSFAVTYALGGPVNTSYFEIYNPLGSSGIVVQGIDTAVMFWNPSRKTVASQKSYAAVYQTEANVLQVFLPASTKVIRRDRRGSAHIHEDPNGYFAFTDNAVTGDQFSIITGVTLTADTDFLVGATIQDTVANLVEAIKTISGLVAFANGTTATYISNLDTNVITAVYTGSESIVGSGPLGDIASLAPEQEGPYVFDTTQPFTVSDIGTTLNQDLDGTMSRVIQVANASNFPDSQGFLILGYGTQKQEGPIPYISRPSNSTLLISPAYTIKNFHDTDTDVALISEKAPPNIARDGSDYPFYITDIVSGRLYAQDLIQSVAATGITVVFTVLYPNDIGLGKFGTIYTENPSVWS